jgi:hypothetical protein
MTTVKGLWHKEKFDDTKEVTRNRKSKDNRYNGQLDKTTTSLKTGLNSNKKNKKNYKCTISYCEKRAFWSLF